ncbi:plakophilin-4-like [Symsagittifera roscoffensis]|uniref:plakophilin-4-like n=1 Tax=Symsagittifera roscoffensis TaxID=84072 RepID=UPI00307C4BB0
MVSAEQQLMDQLRRAREQSEFEDNRTDDIISSVKQQELKYAQLSKQLEEERKTLAEQLEQVELGSETASLRSISESDLGSRTNSLTLSPTPNPNFQYRPHVKVDDYSDTESRSSTAVPAINSSHILNLHPKYISQQQQPTQQSISLPHINSLDHNQNKQVLQEVNQNQSTPDVNNHRRGSEGNRSRGVSSSHSTEATPKSSRRNSPRGPRYNFGVVTAEQRVNIGINQDLEQPVSLPENEQNMRVSRPPSDRRFSGNVSNSYSENVYHPNMPPDRPQLPAVYAGGNFNGGSRYSGRDEFDSGRGGEGEQKYFNDEDAIGFPEQSPSIQFSPPTSLGRGNQLRASRQGEEQQWDSTPDHVYTNGQPPQMARDAMRTPRRGEMGSAGRDSESEGQITPRQQQNSYASYDPRAPAVPRTPGNTGLDQFGQPFHQPTDSDSIQGSVSSYSRNNISNSGNKRQPLGSQHNLNESGLRVPSSASNMQVQTHPYSATHHPHHPATLMIDATSPHAQYINSMSPPESMGQHSPSVHSRTQYPHPAVSATGTPMIFDIGENAHKRDQRWRNPNLIEILEYLDHDDPRIRLNAAAYLQHLTYEDQAMKVKARENRAVNIITKMLDSTEPEMKKHLLGILRNMSFGKGTIENKLEIQRQRLIPMLARMLSTSPDPEIQELCCAILWNISSEPDVKPEIIEHALKVIVDTAVVPESAWLEYERDHNTYLGSDTASLPPSKPSSPQGPLMPPEWSMLFRNATGCLRNLSADRLDYRQTLRQTRHLIDALIHVLNLAILKNEVSGRAVENCICIIRNLTFHLAAELERAGDPRLESAHDMGDHRSRNSRSVSRNSARSDKVGPGCGPKKNKPKSAGGRDDQYRQQDVLSSDPYARGVELLWQPMMANLCIALLRESSNPDTLEAAAGTLQNMCAGAHPVSETKKMLDRTIY